jgi:acetyl-CoA carboxylase carboxyltransferase component
LRETAEVSSIVPGQARTAYDAGDLVRALVDDAVFLELQPLYARNIAIGFARLDGRAVGVVANNPAHLAGVLDIDASDKAARFVRFCDAFNMPIVTFVDTPGYMPGIGQEHGGIIRHGAKLLYAYSEATVPLVTVVVRKAYGGAYIAMASKHLGADRVLALPTAEVAVMGPKGACSIIYRKEIAAAEDPEAKTEALTAAYRETFESPAMAAERGYIDGIVEPERLRIELVRALDACRAGRSPPRGKKHGVMPV